MTLALAVGHALLLRPLANGWKTFREYRRARIPLIPLTILVLMVIMGVFGDLLAPHDSSFGDLGNSNLPPFWLKGGRLEFPLGTDFQGRDILSRILVGARLSMIVAGLGLVGATAVGTLLGLISGYRGGWVDVLIMRLVEIFLSIPGLMLALVLTAALGPSLGNIILVVVIIGWIPYARFVRAEALSLRARDFITSAHAIGASNTRIIFKHLLPNVVPTILVLATLQTGGIILLVASLSFLGVGIPRPNPAWGIMVSDGQKWLLSAWWNSVIPGGAIALLILSLNMLGDWMRDYLDPRLRRQGDTHGIPDIA